MANTIIPKRSSVAGKIPLSTDLQVGEIAVNLADGLIFTKNASDTVITLGGGGGTSLPSQTGNAGKYLTTDGTTASWATIDLSAYLTSATASSTYVAKAGGTMTGKLILPGASATTAFLNIGANSNTPSTISDGDIWINNTGSLNVRLNGFSRVVAWSNVTNTFSSSNTFNSTTTFNQAATFAGQINGNQIVNLPGSTTSNTVLGTGATTGTTTIGGTTQTGALIFGQSTASQTTSIQAGATTSGNTKTINFGTGGLSGSTTAITIGSANGTTVTANGTWTFASTISGSISGNAANVTGTVAVANGGTGATDATTARSNLGLAIGTDVQAWDADLDAIAALADTSGLLRKTAANTWSLDTNTYLTGITSSDVTTALGYTPYNSTNPNGYTSNTGTVTSVGLSLPAIFSVSGSPVTTSGTLSASLASQTANTVLAAPNGVAGAPTFRALVAADIPALSYAPTAGSTSITTLGTIATGTWQGSVIGSTYGGTGVNNGGRTLTINTNSGTLTFTNASTTLTVANTASVSGTNTGDQTITLTGDVTGSGTGSFATTLANSGVTAGTYTKVTVDAKGRVTTGASLASADLPTYTGTLTSSQVTTALGYTPYNSTNPNGYTSNTGTVTSVGLSLPAIFSVTGSPVTTSGTLSASLASQTANTFLAAPNGSAGAPSFRTLVAADIPALTLENLPDAWVKRSVKVATTANITLSGTQTIDGVAVAAGDRVLVKNQTAGAENGIYVASATAWSRAADADTASEIAGAHVNVDQGTANGGLVFDNDFKSTDTLGTTTMTWNRMVDTGYASSTTPLVNGTAAIGTSINYARADHVHPTDTTRASTSQTFFIGTTQVAINRASASLSLTGVNIDGSAGSASTATTATTANGLNTANNYQVNSLGVGTAASATAGEIRATNNITAYYSSDVRFKENIQDIPNALDTVLAIGGQLFDWKDDYIAERGGQDGYFVIKQDFGVIAQNVLAAFPRAVRVRPDGSLAVDYEKLSALSFAAIREQQTQIAEQNVRIKRLEALVEKLIGD